MKIYCNTCGKEYTNTKNMMVKYVNLYICVYCEGELKELKRLHSKYLFNSKYISKDLCSLYPKVLNNEIWKLSNV